MNDAAADVDVEDVLLRAIAYHQAGQLQEAEQHYRAILRAQPGHANANYNLGLVAVQAGKVELAVSHLQVAWNEGAAPPQFGLTLAECFLALGKIGDARRVIEKAMQAGLDTPRAHEVAAQLAGIESGARPLLAVEREMEASFNAGNYAGTEDLARRLLEQYPLWVAGWNRLGLALQRQGKDPIPCYRRALGIDPDSAEVHGNLGFALQERGALDEALTSYARSLKLKPDNAEAYNNIGCILQSRQQYEEALENYRRSTGVDANYFDAHINLASLLKYLGRNDEALPPYSRVVELKPDCVEAWLAIGDILLAQERFNDALASYQHAIGIRPACPEAYIGIGNVLQERQFHDAAITSYSRALELKPDDVEALFRIGNVLMNQEKFDEALAIYQRVLELKPDSAEAYLNIGVILGKQKRYGAMLESCAQALRINPDYAEAHYNRGYAYIEQELFDEALPCYRRALEIKPDYVEALISLGRTLTLQGAFEYLVEGQLDGAMACYQRAHEIVLRQQYDKSVQQGGHRALGVNPSHQDMLWLNTLFCLNYHPDKSAEEIYRVYQEYDAQRGEPLRPTWRRHDNVRDPQRRLRVGYASPDFRQHASAFFLEPLLAHHNKDELEVYAYAELDKGDAMTGRYKGYADHWIETRGMSDEALAERIRSDGIDILVDMAGHTGGNRLLVFARKPAPVSLTWLGYGYTTGLTAIDYFLTDEVTVPDGCEGLFAEQPWRLKTPGYVYRPPASVGEVASLPALDRGYVTFGTLSRSIRINQHTVRVWAELLKAVPGSHLVINSANFKNPVMQERMAARFAEHGIDRERLEIGFHSPPWDVLRGIDIGLDCFPHNSGTTLFETLYMGVPYVTLASRPSVGRLGGSILHSIGHPEWIAHSEQEYIAKAAQLAGDTGRLASLRAGLRGEMERSPLLDEAGFARKVEAAYREMWKIWCANGD